MTHINFGKYQRYPQPEHDEEADQSQMRIFNESRRNLPDEPNNRRSDNLEKPVNKIILAALATENAYQALRDQGQTGNLD